jgi:hypothetical protein
MRESEIEKYLALRVKEMGGLCWKFTSPNLRGVPDRVVLLPGGVTVWVELKATGKTAQAQQMRRHRELRAVGQHVSVLDSFVRIDLFLEQFV